jgi:hypothetical protein
MFKMTTSTDALLTTAFLHMYDERESFLDFIARSVETTYPKYPWGYFIPRISNLTEENPECLARPSVWRSRFPSIYLSVCLSVYLSICLSISVCLSIYLINLSVCLSIYLSICLSVYLSNQSVCLSISISNPSVCLSIHLSICLSIHLSIHPSICLCLSI